MDPMSPGTAQKKLPTFEVKSEPGPGEEEAKDEPSGIATQEVNLPSSSASSSSFSSKGAASSHTAMRKEAKHSRSFLSPLQFNAGVSLTYDDFGGQLGIAYPLHKYVAARTFYQHRSSVRDYGRVARHGGLVGARLALVNPTIFVPIADVNTGYESWNYTVDGAPHHSGGSPISELGAGLMIRLTPYFAITGYRRSANYWEGNPGQDTDKGDWDRKNTRTEVIFEFIL
jgi:hypothetical protein